MSGGGGGGVVALADLRAFNTLAVTDTMRILLVAAANSVHTVQWANAFAGRGHRVHLATQHAPLPQLAPAVQVHRLPHRRGTGYLLNRGLARLADQLRPDVVNVHYASGYGSLVRGLKDVPVVLNVWGSDVYEFPDRSPLHRAWLLGNLKAARTIVSTSEAMAARVRQLLPDAPPITVVPFGVDTTVFTPAASPGEGLPVGTVKTLAPTYGIDRLMQAFAQLPTTSGLRLRIVGDGPEREVLIRLAAQLGVADRTDMVGAVPHARVPDELRKLSVYVALSRAESFGVAVIEASACGLPVVVSDAGGLPEVVRDGVTGFVVPGGDPRVAARRIQELLADPALRTRMGTMGRQFVQERYERSRCVDRMIAVLQQAANP